MPLKTMAKNIAISFLSFPSFLIGLFDIWTHFLLEVLAGIYVYGLYAPITTHVYVKFNGRDLFARGSGGESWTRTAKRTVLWWQDNFLPNTITLKSHYVGKLVHCNGFIKTDGHRRHVLIDLSSRFPVIYHTSNGFIITQHTRPLFPY